MAKVLSVNLALISTENRERTQKWIFQVDPPHTATDHTEITAGDFINHLERYVKRGVKNIENTVNQDTFEDNFTDVPLEEA